MPNEGRYIIRSEDEAWKVFADTLSGEAQATSRTPIEFDGWPRFVIRMPSGTSSITPSMMQGLIEFQKAIYRTHALYRYETADIRFLPDEDKALLEFAVKVSGGSSWYDVDLQEILTRLALEVASKMDPVDIIILALGGGLLLTGKSMWQSYISSRAEQRREETRSAEMREALETVRGLSADEIERTRLVTDALTRHAKLATVGAEADRARQEVLKGIASAGDAEVQGIPVSSPIASELIKGARSQSVETRVDGIFQVLVVDTTSADGFRVRLRNDDSGETFTAGLQDALMSEQQKNAIQDAEWNKKLVRAEINASRLGAELTNAVIIHAEPVDMPAGAGFDR